MKVSPTHTSNLEVAITAIFANAMSIHENVKAIRQARGLRQLDVAACAGLDKSAYSKVERGARSLTVVELHAIAKLFDMSMDQIVDYDPATPQGIPVPTDLANAQDIERIRLISQLPDEDRLTVFRIIDQMIDNHRFREFFAQHSA